MIYVHPMEPNSISSRIRSPVVSVILPVYNGAATLRAAIDSVLAQSYSDYELIVVDDASTDASLAILESYGDRIRLVRRKQNSGICAVARTEGLALARGRYIAAMDQDDLWEPQKLERQVAFMDAHPELPLCHTYAWIIDEHGRRQGIRHQGLIPPTGPCAQELLNHCFITICTLLTRARPLTEADNIHLRPQYANSDYLYFFSELQKSPAGFGFIPEPLASYRRGTQGMSRNKWKWTPEDVPALIGLMRSGLWKGLVSRSDMRRAIVRACRIDAEYHCHRNSFFRVAYFVAHGWWRSPLDLRFPALLGFAMLKSWFSRGRRTAAPRPSSS